MLQSYTAKYTKIDAGYMGQIIEWPEIITEGKDLKEIPLGNSLIEQMPIEVVCLG